MYQFCCNKSRSVPVLTFKCTAVANISTQNGNVTVIQFKNELLLSISGDVILNSIFHTINIVWKIDQYSTQFFSVNFDFYSY